MKKISKQFLFLTTISLLTLSSHAQVKIGDNPTVVHSSSMLELESTNKGFLPPRMNSSQRNAIPMPVAGLVIYNTETNCLNYYVGPNWFESCGDMTGVSAALGSTFTSFSNGAPSNQNFSANTTCGSKLISAGHTSGSCSGSISIGANTYNMVLIHGQCWMQSNLKELPTAPCSYPINTGCNIWLASSPGDIGSWGYYNTVTTNGTAGWRTTEPAANEGLLYQWSAAMNGSTAERSRGVCPSGWHIPSDCEWMYLEHGQGMSIAQQETLNWRTTTGEGSKLSNLTLSGNNSSGFTALFAGRRNITGTFLVRGSEGFWWTSTESTVNNANRRRLIASQAGVSRANGEKAAAFSVRCLKD